MSAPRPSSSSGSLITSTTSLIPSKLSAAVPSPVKSAIQHPISTVSSTLTSTLPTLPDQTSSAFLSLSPFKSLPLPLAQSRLKSNIFVLGLIVFFRSLFTPYRQIRRGIVWVLEEYVGSSKGRRNHWAGNGVWWIETIITLITLFNITEAYLSVRNPSAAPTSSNQSATSGLTLTPSKVSSPLTRAYPTSSPLTPRNPPQSSQTPSRPSSNTQQLHHTPTYLSSQLSLQPRPQQPSPLARTSGGFSEVPHPHRSSPLSASTAEVLDQPFRPRESTGLFYPEDAGASPSKIGRAAQGQGQGQGQEQGQGASSGRSDPGDFVLVEREEKEWVDNVWKGVRGKGGRLG